MGRLRGEEEKSTQMSEQAVYHSKLKYVTSKM
jgi:hypothetical protein